MESEALDDSVSILCENVKPQPEFVQEIVLNSEDNVPLVQQSFVDKYNKENTETQIQSGVRPDGSIEAKAQLISSLREMLQVLQAPASNQNVPASSLGITPKKGQVSKQFEESLRNSKCFVRGIEGTLPMGSKRKNINSENRDEVAFVLEEPLDSKSLKTEISEALQSGTEVIDVKKSKNEQQILPPQQRDQLPYLPASASYAPYRFIPVAHANQKPDGASAPPSHSWKYQPSEQQPPPHQRYQFLPQYQPPPYQKYQLPPQQQYQPSPRQQYQPPPPPQYHRSPHRQNQLAQPSWLNLEQYQPPPHRQYQLAHPYRLDPEQYQPPPPPQYQLPHPRQYQLTYPYRLDPEQYQPDPENQFLFRRIPEQYQPPPPRQYQPDPENPFRFRRIPFNLFDRPLFPFADEPVTATKQVLEPEESSQEKNKKALRAWKDKYEKEDDYSGLVALHDVGLVANFKAFECPICFTEVAPGEGAVLHECLHSFCRECLAGTIEHSDTVVVGCPFADENYKCESHLQEREIKYLVTPEIFEKHLARSLALAESQARDSFHCKTPDCPGWCLFDGNVNAFVCPACQKTNCVTCEAVHEGRDCSQYQDRLAMESDTSEEATKTQKFLKDMVTSDEAMECPVCKVILTKLSGCDAIKCPVCRTDVCWATRGPRWGPGGPGDTSGGCKCLVYGVPCHPNCRDCH